LPICPTPQAAGTGYPDMDWVKGESAEITK
jgi:hypothetical protein